MMIGTANTDANGDWSITSSVLPDGGYHVYALEQHPATPGRDAERTDLTSPVVIDTVGPRIDNVAFDQATGRWAVVVQDSLAGLNQATLADPSNYELIKLHTPFRYQLAVTGVSVSPAASPTAAQTVILQMTNGRRLGPGYYLAAAKSGGIAGNALDGEFVGPLPSGDGHPGGNFLALLTSIHRRMTAQPPDMFAIERASLHNRTFPLVAATKQATDPKVKSVRTARTAHPLRIAAAATHHRVTLRSLALHRHA